MFLEVTLIFLNNMHLSHQLLHFPDIGAGILLLILNRLNYLRNIFCDLPIVTVDIIPIKLIMALTKVKLHSIQLCFIVFHIDKLMNHWLVSPMIYQRGKWVMISFQNNKRSRTFLELLRFHIDIRCLWTNSIR